jgi:hypothetical protein
MLVLKNKKQIWVIYLSVCFDITYFFAGITLTLVSLAIKRQALKLIGQSHSYWVTIPKYNC